MNTIVCLAFYFSLDVLGFDPSSWRIEPMIERIPIRLEHNAVGRLTLVARLLYVELAGEVVAILDEDQATAYSSIRICAEQRCHMVRHEDLENAQSLDQFGHAYLVLDSMGVVSIDEVLAEKHGRVGQSPDVKCTVTCEGCYHSNEVQLWDPVFQYIWRNHDFPIALLVGDADAGTFLEPATDHGVSIEEVFAPLQSNAAATVRRALNALQDRTAIDVLHVQAVSSGLDPCGSLVALLSVPWESKPQLVSYLPSRNVPPPFRMKSSSDCSLGWLVSELLKQDYVLWKHTDRVTLFRPGQASEAPDEVLCYAAYPQLESKDKPGGIAQSRDWLMGVASSAESTLENIRAALAGSGALVDL